MAAKWGTLKAAVAEVIKTNGNQEITGKLLQDALSNIISTIGNNATFAGIATPDTNPGAPDGPIFYLAAKPGTYSNFGGAVVERNAVIFLWDPAFAIWQFLDIDIINKSTYDTEMRSAKRLQIDTVNSNFDLGIADENGKPIIKFIDGGIITKKFNSAESPSISKDEYNSDFGITDENGNTIARFIDGGIITKKFNSAESPSMKKDEYNSDLDIADKAGNVIARFIDGGIITKKFNSRAFSFSGKIINCLGDSITYGVGPSPRANPTWPQGIANNLYATVNNYGVSATSICDGSNESFVIRLNRMAETAIDLLLIFGGTNDFGDKRAVTLGTIDDEAEQGTNFYASFKYLIKQARAKYPNALIGVITPMRRREGGYTKNANGISMLDIVNAELEISKYYGIPVYDFYNEGNIDPSLPSQKSLLTADGLHPNQKGYNEYLIPQFSEFARKLLNFR